MAGFVGSFTVYGSLVQFKDGWFASSDHAIEMFCNAKRNIVSDDYSPSFGDRNIYVFRQVLQDLRASRLEPRNIVENIPRPRPDMQLPKVY